MGWVECFLVLLGSVLGLVNLFQIRKLRHALAVQRLSVLEKVVNDALGGKR